MVRKYFFTFLLILGCIFLGILISGIRINNLSSNQSSLEEKEIDKLLQEIKVGDAQLWVEVVSEKESLKKGLSSREQIGSDGMLFLFDKEQTVAFWMKEMSFDIDIIWISYGTVTEIMKNVPRPDLEDKSRLPLYSPKKPINQALEVMAGDSDRFGISVGDQVILVK